MNGIDILEQLNNLDPELIEGSEHYAGNRKKNRTIWLKLASVAAAVILFTALSIAINPFSDKKENVANTDTAFAFCGANYELADWSELVEYGVVNEQSRFCSEEDGYKAIRSDCGEPMGTVTISIDGNKVNCKLYRHVLVSDRSLCVVEFPDNVYKIYVVKED